MLILLLSKTDEEREFEMLELYTYRDTKNSKPYIHNINIKTFVSETMWGTRIGGLSVVGW